MDYSELTSDFKAHLRRKGYSEKTIRAYEFDVLKLIDFIHKKPDCNGNTTDFFQKKIIESWIDECLKAGNSNKTVSRKIASCKAFFRFLQRENVIAGNPSEGIDMPKVAKKLPASLSQDEIRQLLNAPAPSEKDYLRNRAVLILLYSTGIRVSELISLTIENLSFEKNTLLIKGKGAKERVVPLTDSCRNALLDYFIERESLLPETIFPKAFVFLSRHKKQMSVRMIQYMVAKYGKQVGIMSHIYPHLLRHSIASHLVEEGCHIEAVRQTLGHEDLATTSIYLKTSQKFISDEHKKHNPSDKLLGNNINKNNV